MKDKILSFIGLCRKAGCLVLGRGAVKQEVDNKKVKMVVVTSDLSDRSNKEVREICEPSGVEILKLDITMQEVSCILRKEVGVIAILNFDMAEKIKQMVLNSSEEECSL